MDQTVPLTQAARRPGYCFVRQVSLGRFRDGNRYRHQTRAAAECEAARLARSTGRRFEVFECVAEYSLGDLGELICKTKNTISFSSERFDRLGSAAAGGAA